MKSTAKRKIWLFRAWARPVVGSYAGLIRGLFVRLFAVLFGLAVKGRKQGFGSWPWLLRP